MAFGLIRFDGLGGGDGSQEVGEVGFWDLKNIPIGTYSDGSNRQSLPFYLSEDKRKFKPELAKKSVKSYWENRGFSCDLVLNSGTGSIKFKIKNANVGKGLDLTDVDTNPFRGLTIGIYTSQQDNSYLGTLYMLGFNAFGVRSDAQNVTQQGLQYSELMASSDRVSSGFYNNDFVVEAVINKNNNGLLEIYSEGVDGDGSLVVARAVTDSSSKFFLRCNLSYYEVGNSKDTTIEIIGDEWVTA